MKRTLFRGGWLVVIDTTAVTTDCYPSYIPFPLTLSLSHSFNIVYQFTVIDNETIIIYNWIARLTGYNQQV